MCGAECRNWRSCLRSSFSRRGKLRLRSWRCGERMSSWATYAACFMKPAVRNLVVVLGDQLDAQASALDGFDVNRDVLWMAEVAEESEHVWTSKPRVAVFLAAMRHFRDAQKRLGRLVYRFRELYPIGQTTHRTFSSDGRPVPC